jgi:hypothetical protein
VRGDDGDDDAYHPLLKAVLVEEVVAWRHHVISLVGQHHAHADDALLRLALLGVNMYRPLVVVLVGQELLEVDGENVSVPITGRGREQTIANTYPSREEPARTKKVLGEQDEHLQQQIPDGGVCVSHTTLRTLERKRRNVRGQPGKKVVVGLHVKEVVRTAVEVCKCGTARMSYSGHTVPRRAVTRTEEEHTHGDTQPREGHSDHILLEQCIAMEL